MHSRLLMTCRATSKFPKAEKNPGVQDMLFTRQENFSPVRLQLSMPMISTVPIAIKNWRDFLRIVRQAVKFPAA